MKKQKVVILNNEEILTILALDISDKEKALRIFQGTEYYWCKYIKPYLWYYNDIRGGYSIVYEVILKAINKISTLDCQIMTYLTTGARYALHRDVNGCKKKHTYLSLDYDYGEETSFANFIPDDHDSPDVEFDNSNISEHLHMAINKLPQELKFIIGQRLEGKTYHEISVILNIPHSTVFYKYNKAIKMMKEMMEIND